MFTKPMKERPAVIYIVTNPRFQYLIREKYLLQGPQIIAILKTNSGLKHIIPISQTFKLL